MKIDKQLFRSKLARRIFLMFVCCALIPIFVLSVVSFIHVTGHLKEQAHRRLRTATKSYGLAIYERLLFLDSELQMAATHLSHDSGVTFDSTSKRAGAVPVLRFKSILLVTEKHESVPLSGDLKDPPKPDAEELAALNAGKVVVMVNHRGNETARIFMARSSTGDKLKRGYLIGEINPIYLWGFGNDDSLPHMTELCILDQANRVLESSLPNSRAFVNNLHPKRLSDTSGRFQWQHEDKTYLADYWGIFLKANFFVPKWTVVLFQSKADVLAPMNDFKIFFLLSILMALWIILLLIINFVRKHLGPLERLKSATENILKGNFDNTIVVNSGDEIEALSTSFNKMSLQLGHQFKSLTTIAEIGKETSSVLDINKLVNTVLNVMHGQLFFDRAIILLADREKTSLRCAGAYGFDGKNGVLLRDARFSIGKNESGHHFPTVYEEQKTVIADDNLGIYDCLNSEGDEQPGERDVISMACVPIVYENESLGILQVENTTPQKTIYQSEQRLLEGIASQMAKGIFNAWSFQKLQESQAKLKESHDELEIRVKLRTVDLQRTNRKLQNEIEEKERAEAALFQAKQVAETANRTKSEFLANMSHELRTPLNHIIGFTEIVIDKQVGDINDTQQEFLGDVLKSSHHLLSLINDILDLSKVEAGKLELESSEIQLAALLENSTVMIKEKVMKHGIDLSTDIGAVPDTITADERKLKQILYNLLSNAAKFTPERGAITLTAHPVSVENGYVITRNGERIKLPKDRPPHALAQNGYLEFSVVDTGIGLKKDDINKIFNPFEQADSADNRKYQGTGLGLSLTKRLVELHGGAIFARSDGEGKGSTFSFFIPTEQQEMVNDSRIGD